MSLGWECMVCKRRFPRYVAAHTVPMKTGNVDAAGISHGIIRHVPCHGEVVKLIVGRTGDPNVGDKGRLVIPEKIAPPEKRMVN